jgi:hypothetical protein
MMARHATTAAQVEVENAGSIEVDSERLARLQAFHAALLSAKLFLGAAHHHITSRLHVA